MNKYLALGPAKSLICTLILLITLSIIVASQTMPSAYAADETKIYMDPARIIFVPGVNDSIGTLFNVSVWISDVTDLCSYQVQVRFNNSIVNCTDAIEPVDDADYVLYGTTTYIYEKYVRGTTKLGNYTIMAVPYPGTEFAHFNGTGLITIFTFNITMVPVDVVLFSDLNITHEETFYLDQVADPFYPMRENGYYEIIPEYQPFLTMLALVSTAAVALAIRKRYLKNRISTNRI